MEENTVVSTVQGTNNTSSVTSQTEEERKKEFEANEAKRKAEFDAKKAKLDEEIQIEWEMNTMMSSEELSEKAKEALSADIERITQKRMKDYVGEHIINAATQKELIARHVFHPKKSLTNCFKYINRKAKAYLEEQMKLTGEKPDKNGIIGIDIPDNICYGWAEEYYSSTDISEDHEDEEKFVPKVYTSARSTKTAKKSAPKKKESTPEENPKADETAQLSIL